MKSNAEITEFVKKYYRHDRLEGRNCKDCPNYSEIIINGYVNDLKDGKIGWISQYESATGKTIRFNSDLEIIETF